MHSTFYKALVSSWSSPRDVVKIDTTVALQVATCYPCSVCTGREHFVAEHAALPFRKVLRGNSLFFVFELPHDDEISKLLGIAMPSVSFRNISEQVYFQDSDLVKSLIDQSNQHTEGDLRSDWQKRLERFFVSIAEHEQLRKYDGNRVLALACMAVSQHPQRSLGAQEAEQTDATAVKMLLQFDQAHGDERQQLSNAGGPNGRAVEQVFCGYNFYPDTNAFLLTQMPPPRTSDVVNQDALAYCQFVAMMIREAGFWIE